MSAAETGNGLLLARVGPIQLAFDIASVGGVDLDTDAPTVDAYEALDVPAESGESRRLRFQGRGTFDLCVGSGIQVVHVDDDALLPLPTFLAGLATTVGLVGMVRVDDGFALVMNPSALEPA